MIKKIDHIGIAVKNLGEALTVYRDGLELKVEEIETIEDRKLRIAFIQIGESKIELLEPIGSYGPVAKFLNKRGEGIHHIALQVDDIQAALETMRKKGIQLIDEKPTIGAGGAKVAFLHPKATKGVLLEFCERS